jgi:hypothetical protein
VRNRLATRVAALEQRAAMVPCRACAAWPRHELLLAGPGQEPQAAGRSCASCHRRTARVVIRVAFDPTPVYPEEAQ